MQRVLAIEIGMAGTIRNCKTSGSWRIAGGLLELCHRELPPIITTYFIILGHETCKYTDKFRENSNLLFLQPFADEIPALTLYSVLPKKKNFYSC